MKCKLTIQHVAALPDYQKIFLEFHSSESSLERLLVSELKAKRYVAGKEPKCSLYVGAVEEKIIEGAMARQWSPSYKKFSWNRFWKELRAQNTSYQFPCRCGMWNKSEKTYKAHAKDCATMKEFKVFLARLTTSQIYQEALDAQRANKRKSKKRDKTDTKLKKQRRSSTAKEATKKVARGSARTNK
jgi:hypothetical protein